VDRQDRTGGGEVGAAAAEARKARVASELMSRPATRWRIGIVDEPASKMYEVLASVGSLGSAPPEV
jgi:hypothetical protein